MNYPHNQIVFLLKLYSEFSESDFSNDDYHDYIVEMASEYNLTKDELLELYIALHDNNSMAENFANDYFDDDFEPRYIDSETVFDYGNQF